MADLKGEPLQDALEPEINIPISAFLSESYIPDIDQRMGAYRRLARMTDLKEIADFKAELTDRFGGLPAEAANLLLKIMLKVLAIQAGVKRLDLSDDQVILYFSEAHLKNSAAVVEMAISDPEHFSFTSDYVLKVSLLTDRSAGSPLVQTRNLLKEIARRVDPRRLG